MNVGSQAQFRDAGVFMRSRKVRFDFGKGDGGTWSQHREGDGIDSKIYVGGAF